MPAKRTYNVKASKDFLVVAGVLFFLCLWAIKDGWYPSGKVLKKHPLSVEASFETSGVIGDLYVEVGDGVAEGQVLAELRQVRMQVDFEAAKQTYIEAKERYIVKQESLKDVGDRGVAQDQIDRLNVELEQARESMNESLRQVNAIRAGMEASELESPSKGEVLEVLAAPHTQVDAGEPVVVIDPKDHFYLFNKSLAIFSFIGFFVFLALHLLAS